MEDHNTTTRPTDRPTNQSVQPTILLHIIQIMPGVLLNRMPEWNIEENPRKKW
jgi:hypothetical protein